MHHCLISNIIAPMPRDAEKPALARSSKAVSSGYPTLVAGATVSSVRRLQDTALIRRLLSGEKRAHADFVRRYGRLVYHLLRRCGVPEHHLEDVHQAVYVGLWDRDCRRLRQWSGRGVLSSYITIVVRRIVYDEMRRIATTVVTEPIEEHEDTPSLGLDDPVKALEQTYRVGAISHAIAHLRPAEARIILMRYVEDLPYAEIGQQLNMSHNHVGVALYRGVRKMRALLEAELTSDE